MSMPMPEPTPLIFTVSAGAPSTSSRTTPAGNICLTSAIESAMADVDGRRCSTGSSVTSATLAWSEAPGRFRRDDELDEDAARRTRCQRLGPEQRLRARCQREVLGQPPRRERVRRDAEVHLVAAAVA